MCRRRLHPPRRTVLLVALLEVLLLQAERPPPIRSGGPEVSGSTVQRANQHAEHAGRGRREGKKGKRQGCRAIRFHLEFGVHFCTCAIKVAYPPSWNPARRPAASIPSGAMAADLTTGVLNPKGARGCLRTHP
eukprot:scaffold110054_cov45-Phaeocystis_antarctica.AAC.3